MLKMITAKEEEIKRIETIQQAPFLNITLTDEQEGIKKWIEADYGNLKQYREKLEAEKHELLDLLKSSTEVYLLLFICNAFRGNLSEWVPSFFRIGH